MTQGYISNTPAAGTLTVPEGGTGVTTLGDGYILLGSGSDAITALDVTAKGSLLVGDGTTDPVALAVGANDLVLTADSAEASGLKWAAAGGGGGLVFLASATAAASATLDFTTGIDSTYNNYAFVLNDIQTNVDGGTVTIYTSSDGGATWDGGASDYSVMRNDFSGSSVDVTTVDSASYITAVTTCGNATEEVLNGIMYLYNPSETVEYKTFQGNFSYRTPAAALKQCIFTAQRKSTADIDGVRFTTSGNTVSGTIKLYGITKPS